MVVVVVVVVFSQEFTCKGKSCQSCNCSEGLKRNNNFKFWFKMYQNINQELVFHEINEIGSFDNIALEMDLEIEILEMEIEILETEIIQELVKLQNHLIICNICPKTFRSRTMLNLHIDLFHENLTELKNGKVIEKPTYNFETHTRNPSFESISPKKLIFVEGTLIFHFRRLLSLMLVKVFLFVPENIRYNRRIERDVSERGRTIDSIVNQYKKTVLPMHQKYVEPTKKLADIHISGENNIKNSTKQVIQTIDTYL